MQEVCLLLGMEHSPAALVPSNLYRALFRLVSTCFSTKEECTSSKAVCGIGKKYECICCIAFVQNYGFVIVVFRMNFFFYSSA